jgi:CBS domain-containing protein
MKVNGFMIPTDKVITCSEWDPIVSVVDKVVDNHISAVVIVNKKHEPVGLVTKTDLVRAYKANVSLNQKVAVIMSPTTEENEPPTQQKLHWLLDTQDRDDAAKYMERNHVHHALVKDKEGKFVGLVSAWDITAEVARDSRAWPWNRTHDGRIAAAH